MQPAVPCTATINDDQIGSKGHKQASSKGENKRASTQNQTDICTIKGACMGTARSLQCNCDQTSSQDCKLAARVTTKGVSRHEQPMPQVSGQRECAHCTEFLTFWQRGACGGPRFGQNVKVRGATAFLRFSNVALQKLTFCRTSKREISRF